jgi:hypothetical protein
MAPVDLGYSLVLSTAASIATETEEVAYMPPQRYPYVW